MTFYCAGMELQSILTNLEKKRLKGSARGKTPLTIEVCGVLEEEFTL